MPCDTIKVLITEYIGSFIWVNANIDWSLLLSYGFVGDPMLEMGQPLTEL